MNDIFKDAKFGDNFVTRGGQRAIYHKKETRRDGEVWHYLILEPLISDFMGNQFEYAPYSIYVNKNGKGYPENLKLYDLENETSPNYKHVII